MINLSFMGGMDLKELVREFVKRGILKGTFFTDVGTDDYWGVIDAVFVENLVKLNPES